jgi:hypothetical protein
MTHLQKAHGFHVIACGVLAGLFLSLSCGLVADQEPADALKAAAAEADRLDPGWRWADLMKKRPIVRDEENAVFVLREVNRVLPDGEAREFLESWCAAINSRPILDPLGQITAEFFQKELDKVQPALNAARKFARCKIGRYPGEFQPNYDFHKRPDQGGNPREFSTVLSLLKAEGVLFLSEGKTAEALANLKAMFVLARCLDDSPFLTGYLMGIAIHQESLQFLERFLARAELNEPMLAELQKMLHEERLQPRFLRVLRGERAFLYEISLASKPGKHPPPDEFGWWQKVYWQSWTHEYFVQCNAQAIRHHTAYIEWLKNPTPANDKRLQSWEEANQAEMEKVQREDASARPWGMFMTNSTRREDKTMGVYRRHQALMGCAELAIAIERYRLRHGNWPSALTDIPKDILPSIPPDPFLASQTLRMSRSPYRLVVYSVGPDQVDNDGLLLKGPSLPGNDLGMTLWSETIKGPKGKPAK